MNRRRAKARTQLGPGPEFDIIRAMLGESDDLPVEVLVGPGDDAAVLDAGRLAVSVDISLEGVHFRRDWLSPVEIGYRSVAAALSDLAAMAAVPVAVLVSYALPAGDVESGSATALQRGAEEAARRVGAAVVGGDLSRSPGPLVVDVVALGRAPRPVLRSGARPGDELWVTGHLGANAAAVRLLEKGRRPSDRLRDAYARPVPRVGEALWLEERHLLRAGIDLSDGLASDAAHLAAASGVGIVLEAGRIPLDPAMVAVAESDQDALGMALGGGEDYELCFASSPGAVTRVVEGFEGRFSVPLTRVGRVVEGAGVLLDRGTGDPEAVESTGFDHFRGEGSP